MAGPDESGCRPRLKRFSHWSTSDSMMPLVELPWIRRSLRTEFGETHEFPHCDVGHSESCDVPNPKRANERPNAAVVVVVRDVEDVDCEVVFPFAITGLNGRIEAFHRSRLVDP